MKMNLIRKAEEKDLCRIAEILVFDKRMKYRSIFHDDAYSFNVMQVSSVIEEYQCADILNSIYVYDDGIVKGMIHIKDNEIAELYVDYFFQGEEIGSCLITLAKEKFHCDWLWVLEKNLDAIAFYEKQGFVFTEERKLVENTKEYVVKMKCR